MDLDSLSDPVRNERRTDQRYRRHDPLAFPGLRVRIDYQFHPSPDRDRHGLPLRAQHGDTLLAGSVQGRNASRNPQPAELALSGDRRRRYRPCSSWRIGRRTTRKCSRRSAPECLRTRWRASRPRPRRTARWRSRTSLSPRQSLRRSAWWNSPLRFAPAPEPPITCESRLSAIAAAMACRRSRSIEGMSARSSTRIKN